MNIKMKALSLDVFSKYGTFVNLLHPEQSVKIGTDPGGFYRDMAQVTLGAHTEASFSVSRVYPKPLMIDALEYHDNTGEGMMPLDGDAVICFAPASAAADVPTDCVEAFFVPCGTLVAIRPGVWHCATFPYGEQPLNVMIVLPERVYANDCKITRLAEENFISIEK